MGNQNKNEATLDAKFIDFVKQLNIYLNHFPRHEKFGLSQQIRNKAYEMYGFIVESQKRYLKKTSLTNLDISHEQLRMLIRLAYELEYFCFKNGVKSVNSSSFKNSTARYLILSGMNDEIGKMIGGWILKEKSNKVS